MNDRIQRNQRRLTDLFAGDFPGHAIVFDHSAVPSGFPGDLACPGRPVRDWVDWGLRNYEERLKLLDLLDHDGVPFVNVNTGTEIFAAAFGCPVQVPADSPAFALPLVHRAEHADRLSVPSLDSPPMARVFEFARLMRERVGPEVPISVPDIQSPFDIAALIWKKEEFFMALLDSPDAVKRLVGKCEIFLTHFLEVILKELSPVNLCHCPNAWAPPELGCWLSEDEAGSLSTPMFEEFCLPSLIRMSQRFGGMFVHCCATADHQYESFKRIPNLRGINRVFQSPGPRPAIQAFSGSTVLIMAWIGEEQVHELLDMALPETRFLFNMSAPTIEEAQSLCDRVRGRCTAT